MGGQSGCLGLIIIVAVLYFTDAGSWTLRQLNSINTQCYPTLSGLGPEIANPVCQGVSKGFGAMNQVLDDASYTLDDLKRRIMGDSTLESIDAFASELGRNVSDLASSNADLSRMMSLGPNSMQGFSASQSFQNAIDSFAIGQGYFKDPTTSLQGISWLQRGAQQPMGYGVMSQLSLGSLYARGGQGIPQNPRAAAAYLRQASQSISTLSASNSPQAQQILNTLPASPQRIQRDIERAVQQLSQAMPRR